jgi:hypothetical protein
MLTVAARTSICRDRVKASVLVRAIAGRHCKYFKIRTLRIPGYTPRELSPIVPWLKELCLIRHMFNRHCYTYERLFNPSELDSIIEKIEG